MKNSHFIIESVTELDAENQNRKTDKGEMRSAKETTRAFCVFNIKLLCVSLSTCV